MDSICWACPRSGRVRRSGASSSPPCWRNACSARNLDNREITKMNEAPSRSVSLFGTEETVEPPRLLTAGPLTAEFEAGNLRYIRFDGVEMLRAVSFIVRDKNWGTYNPTITGLKILEDAAGFRVSYDAVARDGSQEFRYSAEIAGQQ